LESLIGSGANAILTLISSICIAQLNVYNLLLSGTYATIIALAVGGLIGGMTSKSGVGAFVISLSYMIIITAIPFILTTISTLNPISAIHIILASIGTTALEQGLTLVVAFASLLIPAAFGSFITAERI
ncbi:MAG: hypothetical protein ACTSYR_03595, partial [Candidatus Odinarchaeia archaeon]